MATLQRDVESDSWYGPLAEVQIYGVGNPLFVSWRRTIYFEGILSNFGGLALSIVSAVGFLLKGYESFVHKKSMVKRLYGESVARPSANRNDPDHLNNSHDSE